MIAAITNEAHGFDVVDLPDPVPGPEEVVIRVAACGVCGSDVKAQPFAPPGMVMGHELGGEIVAVGSAVDGSEGQAVNVAVLPVISCGSCAYCMAGAVAHCPRVQYIGMGPAGGFAEFAVVPARHAFPLPPELPATFAALVEPFAVGLHGVHSAEIRPGDDVLIVGAGGVGLTTSGVDAPEGRSPGHRRRSRSHAARNCPRRGSDRRRGLRVGRGARWIRRCHRMRGSARTRSGVSAGACGPRDAS